MFGRRNLDKDTDEFDLDDDTLEKELLKLATKKHGRCPLICWSTCEFLDLKLLHNILHDFYVTSLYMYIHT